MGACTSKCIRKCFGDVDTLDSADQATSCTMNASSKTDSYLTAEQTVYLGAADCESTVVQKRESAEQTSVEQQIERSKCHWSEISKPKWGSKPEDGGEMAKADVGEEEIARVNADNQQVFRTLQDHAAWGTFFLTFGEGSGRTLKIGDKFAEGAQAELYHAPITWMRPEKNKEDRENGYEWVAKVFKNGTSLRLLQQQWPRGYLQNHADDVERTRLRKPLELRFYCEVFCGTLLEDGRFAFLMRRETEDLRTFIDRMMDLRSAQGRGNCGPFSKITAAVIMYHVAKGMDWLHNHDIVHRDLKASNVLVSKTRNGKLVYFVADFECSVGVVGTRFWRAPEILQALKDRNVSQRPEVFSKEADVYAYGMTCYEILTGKQPFKNHSVGDYDLVLNGARPVVPEYVDDWAHELLRRCWQSNPADRPSFREILDLFNFLADATPSLRKYLEFLFSNPDVKKNLTVSQLNADPNVSILCLKN